MGNDPVFLPRTAHILDQMHAGGCLAMVDASQFFHQFPTHPDDQPHLSLLHPVTKEIYESLGLPVGAAANLPALAGQRGLAFGRMLKAWFQEFQGKPLANCWWTGFLEMGEHDPDKGHGCVLTDESGNPAVEIWAHADNFLIHGEICEKTAQALKLFLDMAVGVGMLCQPKKLTPPTQVVKCLWVPCGLSFTFQLASKRGLWLLSGA
jgi:hypothetical protein